MPAELTEPLLREGQPKEKPESRQQPEMDTLMLSFVFLIWAERTRQAPNVWVSDTVHTFESG
ncbi:unnamed protein product [Ectocarpus sp. CCAP 1310/34]|nr:unnamed protein product [Ectocarpus sp. CCAP 1310/34]